LIHNKIKGKKRKREGIGKEGGKREEKGKKRSDLEVLKC
jgi:hypothetical protein